MILENIKFNKFYQEPTEILRLFLAAVFLSAGVFRIIYPASSVGEFSALHLPVFFAPLMIVFEIISGLLLLLNKFSKQVYGGLIIFMIVALGWALIISGSSLIKASGELFVFNLNPTDFFLHSVFLLILIILLIQIKQKKR